MRKVIILLSAVCLFWAGEILAQSVQSPTNVSISKDGLNRVDVENVGGKYALTVTCTNCGSTSSGVLSFNTRTGSVTSQSDDYAAFYLSSSWTPTWLQIGSKPTTLSGYGITDPIQTSVTGSCLVGSGIRVINSDGSVICQSLSAGAVAWGAITGTLSDQTDVFDALSAKMTASQVSSAISSSAVAADWQSGAKVVSTITSSITALNVSQYQTAAQVSSAISASAVAGNWQSGAQVVSTITSSIAAIPVSTATVTGLLKGTDFTTFNSKLSTNGNGSLITGLMYSQLTGTPTWNQNTTGTSAGLSTTLAIGSGGTGTTSFPTGILKGAGVGAVTAITDNSANWNTAYGWGNWAHTTLSGYGITDALASSWTPTWGQVGNKPTTLTGFGITDALASSYTGSTGITTLGTIGTGSIPWARIGGAPVSAATLTCNSITQKLYAYASDTGQFTCGTDQTSAGGGYATIQDEGTPLTQENTLNFTGAGVTCSDVGGVTTCAIPSWATAPSGTAPVVVNNGAFATSSNLNLDAIDFANLVSTGSTTVEAYVPWAGTITASSIYCQATSTISAAIYTAPPNSNTWTKISASAPISLSNASYKANDTTLSGWTTAFSAGYYFRAVFNAMTGGPCSIGLIVTKAN